MLVRRVLSGVVIALSLWLGARAALPGAPELVSMFPFGGQQGAEFIATVRGRSLDSVTGVWLDRSS
jgi:hypothetical protein